MIWATGRIRISMIEAELWRRPSSEMDYMATATTCLYAMKAWILWRLHKKRYRCANDHGGSHPWRVKTIMSTDTVIRKAWWDGKASAKVRSQAWIETADNREARISIIWWYRSVSKMMANRAGHGVTDNVRGEKHRLLHTSYRRSSSRITTLIKRREPPERYDW